MHKNFYQIGKAKRKYREENDGAYTTSKTRTDILIFLSRNSRSPQKKSKICTNIIHQVTELDFIPVTQSTGADLITFVNKRLEESQ